MPITVIVGGQFGSEGKGKVAHWIARESNAKIVVRVGGSNSGHTVVTDDGHREVFRHLPTSALLPDVICVIPPGAYIDPDILEEEIVRSGLDSSRLIIDPNTWIITDDDRSAEADSELSNSIGSTLSGTGEAVKRRIKRLCRKSLASERENLNRYVQPTGSFLHAHLMLGERVIVEGTQGFGLSLLHASEYPYVTSRDTTAAAFLSEAGVSPRFVDDIVLVIRSYPIRVGGNSGPLPRETSWQDVTIESGSSTPIVENTSVTNRIRRVAHFDIDVVERAIKANHPTRIVLNHLDYIDYRPMHEYPNSMRVSRFLDAVEESIGVKVDLLGFGPGSLVHRSSLRCSIREVLDKK